MSPASVVLLLALSAIWGSSFIFMRHLAPILGPVVTADMRVLIAGVALAVFFAAIRFKPEWRKNWKHFLVLGMVNSGIPFLLYSFAAPQLPGSLEAILNSTAPLFGAIFSAIWLAERLTLRKAAGLLLGIAGGSQLAAGLVLLPLVFVFPPRQPVTLEIGALTAAFAIVCSAAAYLIYYRLISDIGPTRALTVTFLIPVFAMAWGALFLGETITVARIAGAAVILAGTALIAIARAPRAA